MGPLEEFCGGCGKTPRRDVFNDLNFGTERNDTGIPTTILPYFDNTPGLEDAVDKVELGDLHALHPITCHDLSDGASEFDGPNRAGDNHINRCRSGWAASDRYDSMTHVDR